MTEKQHVSIVVCGHVDAGKSTTTGHLIYKLGGINDRDLDKLQKEADAVGKSSFAFAFLMDKQKEERLRGVTIQVTTKEFFTDSKHYTILDAPGHRKVYLFIFRNLILFYYVLICNNVMYSLNVYTIQDYQCCYLICLYLCDL